MSESKAGCRVQGVWYRGWTVQQAALEGLDGWVQNQPDGTVRAVFSGEDAAVDAMLLRCYQGPPFARVEKLHVENHAPPEGSGFYIRRSMRRAIIQEPTAIYQSAPGDKIHGAKRNKRGAAKHSRSAELL